MEGLLKRGKAVRAVTRTGNFSLGGGGGDALMTTAAGDVTKADTLKEALAGCGAVLFCASASKVCSTARSAERSPNGCCWLRFLLSFQASACMQTTSQRQAELQPRTWRVSARDPWIALGVRTPGGRKIFSGSSATSYPPVFYPILWNVT